MSENIWATVAFGAAVLFAVRHRSYIKQIFFKDPLKKRIQIIENEIDCVKVVNDLKKHCLDYQVLGFDCEWVTVGGSKRPIALLQLASNDGLCALFRLNCLRHVPMCLRELLENDKVIKVGVVPKDDAQKLSYDYGVGVASTLDLRFLASMTGHKAEGLAKLSKTHLNVELDKNWRLICSDWEARVLNESQLNYAANDALVAIKIFKKLTNELQPRKIWQFEKNDLTFIIKRLEPFFDVRFKDKHQADSRPLRKKIDVADYTKYKYNEILRTSRRVFGREFHSTRSKILYDNCFLEAPDGEVLCTIDRKKAKWYITKKLGYEVNEEPYTVRLIFEPAGRAVGDVGKYYQTPKENRCVVCGRQDAYLRKNVVPREYRKHFPVVMKSHTSHDVLLLCPTCHQLSNISDLKIRKQLAVMCNAPFSKDDGGMKYIEDPELRKLKSAARALLYGQMIPVQRRMELEHIISNHYGDFDFSVENLKVTANIDSKLSNDQYCQHGEKVVLKYEKDFGGLIELEQLWREHFQKTMKPKFLPDLWNVNHNANRLSIRAQQGRISKKDLIASGVCF